MSKEVAEVIMNGLRDAIIWYFVCKVCYRGVKAIVG